MGLPIEQLALLDVAVIHETIEHVFVTNEQICCARSLNTGRFIIFIMQNIVQLFCFFEISILELIILLYLCSWLFGFFFSFLWF